MILCNMQYPHHAVGYELYITLHMVYALTDHHLNTFHMQYTHTLFTPIHIQTKHIYVSNACDITGKKKKRYM